MGFLANLFAYPYNDPWIQDLNEKIINAETDEEREEHQNELNNRLSMMINYNWF